MKTPHGIRCAAEKTEQVLFGKKSVALEIDLTIYSLDAVFRACYAFTDRCFLFLARQPQDPERLIVTISARGAETSAGELEELAGSFCNDLIDQELRCKLARQAGPLRELIVAQAFAEGNLLDPERDDEDFEADPRGFGRR